MDALKGRGPLARPKNFPNTLAKVKRLIKAGLAGWHIFLEKTALN
jgi:hypothetical protein